MKMRILTAGNDGTRSYKVGDEYDGDGEWARRMLVNGHAEPLDEAAEKIAADAAQQARYHSAALAAGAPGAKPAPKAARRK
ncbi:MAG: hypothetical protein ACK4UO_06260 [Pseudolabrys sp.]